MKYTTHVVSLLVLVIVVSVIQSEDPCYIISGGYETFIRNVPEDTPVGKVLGKLNVSGTPSEVELEQHANSFLLLNNITREITLNNTLDTDRGGGTVIMKVDCKKLNVINPPVIILTVRIILEDVNDNRPIFDKHHYFFNVSENSRIGTSIYSGAIATDADQRGGGNDQISYRILPGLDSDYFDIEYPLYPDIKLKRPLDYESLRHLTIRIEAKDNPIRGESLSSTTMVTFNVVDEDDLNPAFHSALYIATVNINDTVGTIVPITPTINASDQDALNAPVAFQLYDPEGTFAIDSATGTVYINTRLSAPYYAVVLKAIQTDNPLRYGTALLKINVQTTSNASKGPVFPKPMYETTISEDQPVGTTFMSAAATVSSSKQSIQYSIKGKVPEFDVDQRGGIKLTKEIDYEIKTQYNFFLTASDGAKTSSTRIRIWITDVNDNNPIVHNNNVSITTERIMGSILTKIKATDRDSNNSIRYKLMNFRHLFAVTPSGDLSIIAERKELDLDTYHLVLKVCDNGKPPREALSLVTVKFPYLNRPYQHIGMTTTESEALAVVFGSICAVFLVLIILLMVYIVRRQAYTSEQLDKAKQSQNNDAKGLTYKPGDPSPDPSRIEYNAYAGEPQKYGSLRVQGNHAPVTKSNCVFNNQVNNSTNCPVEPPVETTVIPLGKSFNNYEERRQYQNGMLKTFQVPEGSSSGESSDSTGDSNKALMKNSNSFQPKSKKLTWGSTERINNFDDAEKIEKPQESMPKMNIPQEKSEITVYF